MNKLFVGSLGVFGVILETTYRLAALPEDDRVLAMVLPDFSQAVAAAAAIQGSQLLPSALMVLSAEVAAACPVLAALSLRPPQVVLLVNVDGMHEAVERQVRDSRHLCRQHAGTDDLVLSGATLLTLWEFQEAWRAAPAESVPTRIQVRIGTLPGALGAMLHQLTTAAPFSRPVEHWLADYTNGQIIAHLSLPQAPVPEVLPAVRDWLQRQRAQGRDQHGYCMVEYAPAPLRQQLDLWGEAPGQQLLRLYKQRFDPHVVLNPGRYVAGL
jgi:FAD/FMN-containing dehydrogenase